MSYSKGLPNPGMKAKSPVSLALKVDSYPLIHGGKFPFGIFVKSNLKQCQI